MAQFWEAGLWQSNGRLVAVLSSSGGVVGRWCRLGMVVEELGVLLCGMDVYIQTGVCM